MVARSLAKQPLSPGAHGHPSVTNDRKKSAIHRLHQKYGNRFVSALVHRQQPEKRLGDEGSKFGKSVPVHESATNNGLSHRESGKTVVVKADGLSERQSVRWENTKNVLPAENRKIKTEPTGINGKQTQKPLKKSPGPQLTVDLADTAETTVKKPTLSGSAETMLASFTRAPASQIAAGYADLGPMVAGRLSKDQLLAQKALPPLSTHGKGGPGVVHRNPKLKSQTMEIGDGGIGPEPEPPKPDLQKQETVAFENRELIPIEKGAPDEVHQAASKTIENLSTTVSGLKTNAGATPGCRLEGKADPGRLQRLGEAAELQANAQKAQLTEHVKNHPGPQQIQPADMNRTYEIPLPETEEGPIPTKTPTPMAQYAAMTLPPRARAAADARLAPMLTPALTAKRAEIDAAVQARDQHREQAVLGARAETAKANQTARNYQDQVVAEARREVDEHQLETLQRADEKVTDLNRQSEEGRVKAWKEVDERSTADRRKADAELRRAEREAQKVKGRAEDQAAAEKHKAMEATRKKSWWRRALDAVKNAVKRVVKTIGKILDAAARLVKSLIEAAKAAALAIIEAGRKWIVARLDAYANMLKLLVNQTVGVLFPRLAELLNAKIDATARKAKAAVNQLAQGLAKAVEQIAASLGKLVGKIFKTFKTLITTGILVMGALLTGNFKEVARLAFEGMCQVLGIDPGQIFLFLKKAGTAIGKIYQDPVAFLSNLVSAVKQGIGLFLTKARKHILGGIVTWLVGALSAGDIQLPQKWNAKGVFSLVVNLLGMDWASVRAKLVKRLGPDGETRVSVLEKGFEMVKEARTKGLSAFWGPMKEKVGDMKAGVFGALGDWLKTKIFVQGAAFLASLLVPVTAVLKAVKTLFNLAVFLVTRWQVIVQLVTSIVNSVTEISLGNLGKAAKAVETAMARSVPVLIGFFAALIGLGDVGKAIRKVIQSFTGNIHRGIEAVITWLVKKAKALWKRGKGLINLRKTKGRAADRKWPLENKGRHQHQIFLEKQGYSWATMISSIKMPLASFVAKVEKFLGTLEPAEKIRYRGEIKKVKAIQANLKSKKTMYRYSRKKRKVEEQLVYFEWDTKLGKEIQGLMGQLCVALAELPEPEGKGKIVRPPSDIEYHDLLTRDPVADMEGPTTDARMMTAHTLSSNPGKHHGYRAEYESSLYIALSQKRGRTIAPGHLLNHHLYGKGDKDNIAAMTSRENSRMSKGPEKALQKLVLADNEVVKYKVKVNYPEKYEDRGGYFEEDNLLPKSIDIWVTKKKFDDTKLGKKDGPKEIEAKKANSDNWIEGKPVHYPIKVDVFKGPSTSNIFDNLKEAATIAMQKGIPWYIFRHARVRYPLSKGYINESQRDALNKMFDDYRNKERINRLFREAAAEARKGTCWSKWKDSKGIPNLKEKGNISDSQIEELREIFKMEEQNRKIRKNKQTYVRLVNEAKMFLVEGGWSDFYRKKAIREKEINGILTEEQKASLKKIFDDKKAQLKYDKLILDAKTYLSENKTWNLFKKFKRLNKKLEDKMITPAQYQELESLFSRGANEL